MNQPKKNVLIFIFYKNKKVLLENRIKGQYLEFKKIYPGGKVEMNENDDFNKTLYRECNEEFGIKPQVYRIINEPVLAESDYYLWPCLITKWRGRIPDKVKDKGSALEWVDMSDYKPEIESLTKVTQIVRKFIVSHNIDTIFPLL